MLFFLLSYRVSKNTAPFVPYVHVYSDGMIYDYSPVRVVSTCRLNIYTFPFDVQNCTFTFVSYSHKSKHGYEKSNFNFWPKKFLNTIVTGLKIVLDHGINNH